jgi:hypothetical protein
MPLSTNRATFTFNHTGQFDEYGASVGNYATVQENFDSRAEENLTDINNIKTTLTSETEGDSGAHNVKSAGIAGILSGAAASVYAMLSALKSYVDTVAANFQLGILLDDSVTDTKLSNTAGQIKDRLTTHVAEVVSQMIFATRDTSVAGVQTITGLNQGKIPKRIEVRTGVNDAVNTKMSVGSWESNGGVQSCVGMYKNAGSFASHSSNTAALQSLSDSGNAAVGTIQNVTDTQFEINWAKIASPTGTITIQVIAHYH